MLASETKCWHHTSILFHLKHDAGILLLNHKQFWYDAGIFSGGGKLQIFRAYYFMIYKIISTEIFQLWSHYVASFGVPKSPIYVKSTLLNLAVALLRSLIISSCRKGLYCTLNVKIVLNLREIKYIHNTL